MNIKIRKVKINELTIISSLIYESAYFLKESDFYDNGWSDFVNSINAEELLEKYKDKDNKYYCAVLDHEIVGVICLRKLMRINQLFISSKLKRNRIGQQLLDFVLSNNKTNKKLKVNSSSYAVDFYESNGFRSISGVVLSNGFKYIPMEKNIGETPNN